MTASSSTNANDQGLINQGWKDSWDGINFADGRIAEAPIALCEVQGYVYSAYIARAWMAHNNGDEVLAAELRDRAERLKNSSTISSGWRIRVTTR